MPTETRQRFLRQLGVNNIAKMQQAETLEAMAELLATTKRVYQGQGTSPAPARLRKPLESLCGALNHAIAQGKSPQAMQRRLETAKARLLSTPITRNERREDEARRAQKRRLKGERLVNDGGK